MLYYYGGHSRKIRWVGIYHRMGEIRNFYKILVGIPKEKRPIVRPRHMYEDITKMDRKGSGCEDMNRFVCLSLGFSGDCCEHGNEISCSKKAGISSPAEQLSASEGRLHTLKGDCGPSSALM
jgi:hypothetical protein